MLQYTLLLLLTEVIHHSGEQTECDLPSQAPKNSSIHSLYIPSRNPLITTTGATREKGLVYKLIYIHWRLVLTHAISFLGVSFERCKAHRVKYRNPPDFPTFLAPSNANFASVCLYESLRVNISWSCLSLKENSESTTTGLHRRETHHFDSDALALMKELN